MTPEQMQAEIKRLRRELADARLEAQEAWDAYDYALARENRTS